MDFDPFLVSSNFSTQLGITTTIMQRLPSNITTADDYDIYINYTTSADATGNREEEPFPPGFLAANAFIRALQGFMAIGCNVLTVLAIVLYKHLQTCTNYLLVVLAVADICGGIISLVHVAMLIVPMSDSTWIITCTFYVAGDILSAGWNVLTILMISVDRFIFILYPLRYYAIVTNRVIIAFMACATAITGATVAYTHCCSFGVRTEVCTFEILKGRGIVTDYEFYVVTFVTLAMYFSISTIACRQSRSIAALEKSEQTVIFKKEGKITKMLALVLGLYLLCYIPQTILSVTVPKADGGLVYKILNRVFSWFWWVNSWANPLIYVRKNKDFRKAIEDLLHLNKKKTDGPI